MKVKVKSLSHVQLFATVPHQAPLSMGFSRQEYWSGLPFPSPGNLPNPGIEFSLPCRQTLYSLSHKNIYIYIYIYSFSWFPRWLSGKESACQRRRHRFDPWGRTFLWRRK